MVCPVEKYPEDMQKRIQNGKGCGVDYFPGWQPLILVVDQYLKHKCPDYVIDQIKNKFDGLRFYIRSDEEISEEDWRFIWYVEALTTKMCSQCGAATIIERRGEKHCRVCGER